MNPKLFNPDYLLHLCQKYGLKPSKKYGQNFLLDPDVIETMITAAEVSKKDTVVEVGPGFGVLTFALAEKAQKVVAFEIEKKLQDYWAPFCHQSCHPERGEAESKDPLKSEHQGISPLTATLGRNDSVDNLQIVWGNILREFPCHPHFVILTRQCAGKDLLHTRHAKEQILRFTQNDSVECQNDSYKVVANLPYQITSNVIRVFLESENQPSTMTLMVQKEVAERICAKPGDMSLLSLSVQYYADAEIVAQVPRTLFWPEPAVDSAVIKLTARERCHPERGETESKDPLKSERKGISPLATLSRNDKCVQVGDFEKRFFRLVKIGFAQKRKLLLKNLLPSIGKDKKELLKNIFLQIGLNEKARAQELSLEQWQQLVKLLNQ